MFLLGRQFYWLQICLAIFMQQQQFSPVQAAKNSEILAEKILQLLNKIEEANDWNINIKFALHLSEFIIKQKVRSYEPTRYEAQLYYKILQKINKIISESELASKNAESKSFLKHILHRDLLPTTPMLKTGNIVKNLEYKPLLQNYDQLVNVGAPDWNLSGSCLNEFAELRFSNCSLSKQCLDVMISDLETYGYHRTHQILLLFLFTHHRCSTLWGSRMAYEILASEKCSAVFREQNVIRSLGIPNKYKDLFLEQNVICGLFGYPEFLNIPNLTTLMSWPQMNGCFCLQQEQKHMSSSEPLNCNCSNHLNSLALAFYVNALIMLG